MVESRKLNDYIIFIQGLSQTRTSFINLTSRKNIYDRSSFDEEFNRTPNAHDSYKVGVTPKKTLVTGDI